MKNVKVALVQMSVENNVENNLKRAEAFIKKASGGGAQIVCLPEMFCCPYENPSFVKNAEPRGGRIWRFLADTAKKNNILLIGGSFPEKENGNLYNTCFVFDGSGREIAFHRKAHMFDVDIKGGQYFKESDTFTPGDNVTVFDSEFGKIGLEICFDIRFPSLTQKMAGLGAQMIFVPASFNMTTGPAHWELLFRARALDNQLYVLGCAAARNNNSNYRSYGNSIITSPWGEVISRLDEKEGKIIKTLDLDKINTVRRQIPLTGSLI